MSGTNRFMSPVRDTNKQTYVSQYVPMPFEVMQKKAQSDQKRNDTVKNNWATLQEKMGEKLLDADSEMMNEKMTEIESNVNSAIEESNGDYRGLNDVITSAAANYNKDIKSGELSFAKTQLEKFKSNEKALDAQKNMPGDIKALMKKRLLDDYSTKNEEGVGGQRAGNQMGEAIIYDPEGLQKELQGYISSLNLNKDKNAIDPQVSFNEGKLLITGFDSTNELTKERIQQMSTVMYENPKFNAMVNGEYFALNPDETKEEYKKKRFAQLFQGFNAAAYKETAEKRNATQIKEKKIQEQSDKDFKTNGALSVSDEISVGYDANKEFLDEKGNVVDEPLNIIRDNNLKSGNNFVQSTLKDIYFESREGISNDENQKNFDDDFKSFLTTNKIPFEKDKPISNKTYNSFLKYVATEEASSAKEFSKLFNGETPKMESFITQAKQEYKQVLNRNQFLKEAEDQLREEGSLKGNLYYKGEDGSSLEISADDFKEEQKKLSDDERSYLSSINTLVEYKEYFQDSKGEKESLTSHLFDNSYTFIQAGGVNSQARKILDGLDDMDKFVKEGKGEYEDFWTGRSNNPSQEQIVHMTNLAKRRKAVLDGRKSIQLKKDGEFYQDKLNEVMKARLVGGSVTVPTSNQLSIDAFDKNTGTWKSQTLTAEKVRKTMEDSFNQFSQKELIDSSGKKVTIKEIGNSYPPDKQENFKKEFLGSLMFTETIDPTTGSMEMVFVNPINKEKYRMKVNIGGKGGADVLGFGSGKIRINANKVSEMKLMNDIYQAKIGNLKSAAVGDPSLGVSINTKREGTVDKGLSFNDQFAVGGNYEVNINPMKLGLYIKDENGKFKDNLSFPKTGENPAVKILRTYQTILDGKFLETLSEEQKEIFKGKKDKEIAKIYLKQKIRENIIEGSEEDGTKEKAIIDREAIELNEANVLKIEQRQRDKAKYIKTQEDNKAQELYEKKKEIENNYIKNKPKDKNEIKKIDNQIKQQLQKKEKKAIIKQRIKNRRAEKVLNNNTSTEAEKITAVDSSLDASNKLIDKKKLIDKVLVGERMNPLEFAYSYLGIKETDPLQQAAIKGFLETAAGLNKYNKKAFTVGNKSNVTKGTNAWCGAFVDHVLRSNKFDTLKTDDQVNNIRALKYDNNSIGKKITKEKDYKPGDIMILKTPVGYHVGFYSGQKSLGKNKDNEDINQKYILGGNQRDQVNVMPVPSSYEIVSVRRVKNFEEIDKTKLDVILSKNSLSVYKEQVKAQEAAEKEKAKKTGKKVKTKDITR